MKTLIVILKGAVIGIANIIPGVSGGTIAVIMGIYDRLIEAISCVTRFGPDMKGQVLFLMKIFAGAGIALLLLANLMEYLLAYHYEKTMFLFMGLIFGGIPVVVRSHGDMRVTGRRSAMFVIGLLLIMSFSFMNQGHSGQEKSPQAAGYLFLLLKYLSIAGSGFLAGAAMIIPGVSGSLVLVLLGKYYMVISAIKGLELKPLLAIGMGAMAGIFVFSRAIDMCLKKAPSETYYFILGLVAASFLAIFPGFPLEYKAGSLCVISFISGTVVSLFLARTGSEAPV